MREAQTDILIAGALAELSVRRRTSESNVEEAALVRVLEDRKDECEVFLFRHRPSGAFWIKFQPSRIVAIP